LASANPDLQICRDVPLTWIFDIQDQREFAIVRVVGQARGSSAVFAAATRFGAARHLAIATKVIYVKQK
jgi:hypothetical protein